MHNASVKRNRENLRTTGDIDVSIMPVFSSMSARRGTIVIYRGTRREKGKWAELDIEKVTKLKIVALSNC